MRRINKNNIKLAIGAVAVGASIFGASIEFGLVKSDLLKVWALVILAIALISNLVIEINDKLHEHELEAREVINRALDFGVLAVRGKRTVSIRASIFILNKKRLDQIENHFHSSNMEAAKDLKIKFDKWQGCVGKCWGYETPVLAIASELQEKNMNKWGITNEQFALTKDIQTIISFPIRNPEKPDQIIGILSLDSTSDLQKLFVSQQTTDIVADLSGLLGRLLFEFNIKRPLNN